MKLFRLAVAMSVLASTVVGVSMAAPAAFAETPPAPHAEYVPVTPRRVLDTRDSGTRLAGGGQINVDVAGSFVTNALHPMVAALVTITAVGGDGPGYVTAFQPGQLRVDTTLMTTRRAAATAATAIVNVNDRKITVYASNATDVIVDVSGYFVQNGFQTTAGRFWPVPAQRLLDSRTSDRSPLPAASTTRLDATAAGVPVDAVAVVVNLTATNARSNGYVTGWAANTDRPTTSNLNASVGPNSVAVSANLAVIPLTEGWFDLFTSFPGDLIVDVSGYFTGTSAPPTSTGYYIAKEIERVLDTREVSSIPPDAGATTVATFDTNRFRRVQALVVTVTVTQAIAESYVTVHPIGTARPDVSTLNPPAAGATVRNTAIIGRLDGSEAVGVYTSGGGHIIVDVSGYFTS